MTQKRLCPRTAIGANIDEITQRQLLLAILAMIDNRRAQGAADNRVTLVASLDCALHCERVMR